MQRVACEASILIRKGRATSVSVYILLLCPWRRMVKTGNGGSLARSGFLRPRPVQLNVLVLLLLFFSGFISQFVSGTAVFKLQHKFASSGNSKNRLKEFKEHDRKRHRRILENVEILIGGSADPLSAGLYYAEIGIGTPVHKYYVQIDTGSDLLWLNCAPCGRCPSKSGLGVELTLYDLDKSSTGSAVMCGQSFCDIANQYQSVSNCYSGERCPYSVQYGDGSTTTGYYVKDTLQYNEVVGDYKTQFANTSIYFGCGAHQTGELQSSDQALDGILGLGQANTSFISQLASSGKVPNEFAHCLDGDVGGGIFVIGHVVQKGLRYTPLVPDQSHYNVNLEGIDLDGSQLPVDKSVFKTTDKQGTIIDSGTTLAYISTAVFKPLIAAIMAAEPGVDYVYRDGTYCFLYDGSVDKAFPTVNFQFEGSVTMRVYPHDYLVQDSEDAWCIGWMDSGENSDDNKYMTILGDLVLKNRLIVYDLGNQTIGWVDYNCSSSVKMQADSGYEAVAAHHLSLATVMRLQKIDILLKLFLTMLSLLLI